MDLSPMRDPSLAAMIAHRLVRALGRDGAHKALDLLLGKFTTVELAALAKQWNFWARPKQLWPSHRWRSCGFLAGRGFGKSVTNAEQVNEKIERGKAMLVGLSAQDEENTIGLQVHGPSGLIATSKPWFRPVYEVTSKQLVYPNGARAIVRTPERPGKIRGWEYELSWLTEIQSWPKATRAEALLNFRISTRLGDAQIVWDATPKRGHPLLLDLLAEHEADPMKHVIIRGSTQENACNLGEGYVEDLVRKIGGTQQGLEELEGQMLRESARAVAREEWIERSRRPMPDRFARRGLGIDPAITARAGSDRTGIVEAGLGADGQGYVIGDYTSKHEPHAWGKIIVDKYVDNACDIVVVETNRGGRLVTQNIRAIAEKRKLQVVVLGEKEQPHRARGVIYVREVHASGPKLDRAIPLSTAYEQGRISHVIGAALDSLETTVTTWEPKDDDTIAQDSPDDLDALNHIMSELLGLRDPLPDPRAGFGGIGELQRALGGLGGDDTL